MESTETKDQKTEKEKEKKRKRLNLNSVHFKIAFISLSSGIEQGLAEGGGILPITRIYVVDGSGRVFFSLVCFAETIIYLLDRLFKVPSEFFVHNKHLPQ